MPLATLKAVLVTIALVLGIGQALTQAQVRGFLHLLPFEKRTLVRFHRWEGRSLVALVLLIVGICLWVEFGLGYTLYSLRLQAHAVLGSLLMLVLFVKVAIVQHYRQFLRHTLVVGATAGLLLLGTFFLSAVWYFLLEGA